MELKPCLICFPRSSTLDAFYASIIHSSRVSRLLFTRLYPSSHNMCTSSLSSPPPYKLPGKKPVQAVRFSDDLEIIPEPMSGGIGELVELPGDTYHHNHIKYEKFTPQSSTKQVRFEDDVVDATCNLQQPPENSSNTINLRGCLAIIAKWLISDPLVLTLILLTLILAGFSISIAGWAARDLESLCNFNPGLTTFYNGLWPAFVTILPGLLITIFLLPSMPRSPHSKPPLSRHFQYPTAMILSRRGWTRPRIFFMCIFVGAVTLVVAPWTQGILEEGWKMSCEPYLKDQRHGVEGVWISERNYTEFCANVFRKGKDEFSAQAEAWKHNEGRMRLVGE